MPQITTQSNAGTSGIRLVGTHNQHCFDFHKHMIVCINFGGQTTHFQFHKVFILVCSHYHIQD